MNPATTEWSVSDVARATGTTSRTLRHYHAVGLLPPSRTGTGGYRFYDADALVRLQRILLLRDLGLGLGAIADVLAGERQEADTLAAHLVHLRAQRERVDRQIVAVQHTITTRREGGQLVPEKMFDGFDHTAHAEEVTSRWGNDAWQRSDDWWRALGEVGRAAFQAEQKAIATAFDDCRARGVAPAAPEAAALAARHHAWLRGPSGDVSREHFEGLAEMYAADARFAAAYGGPEASAYVRDALREYAATASFGG